MFKALTTLIRGAAAAAEEEFTDRNALPILDQQIRDVAAGLERSKRALALAIAQEAAESERRDRTQARIDDLEARAVEAIRGGREDLAEEAAEAIAALEADREASRETLASFTTEIGSLRRGVSEASRRLAELRRGRQIAQAAEAVRRLKVRDTTMITGTCHTLAEAEATLRRLRERQVEAMRIDMTLETLNAPDGPAGVADRLGIAGFGPPTKPTAASVLDRLKNQAAATQA